MQGRCNVWTENYYNDNQNKYYINQTLQHYKYYMCMHDTMHELRITEKKTKLNIILTKHYKLCEHYMCMHDAMYQHLRTNNMLWFLIFELNISPEHFMQANMPLI